MEFNELVKKRRSVRSYKQREVSDMMISGLLEAARWAPSAGNLQPWHFVVVKNKEVKEKLAQKAYGRDWLATAPVIIIVCAIPDISAEQYSKRGRNLYCIQDTAAAIQNILLSAKEQGLGSCWVGAFDEDMCSQILGLSERKRPVAMISVGYPAKEQSPPERKALENIVDYVF